MRRFLRGTGLIISLELRQRVRGVAWYVLIGSYFVLVTIVAALVFLMTGGTDGWFYSLVTYFVLLLATLVTPALSGNALNGDRSAGTLATTQVTLVTTANIVLGKFVAAWIATLAFLAVSAPFLIVSAVVGRLSAGTILVSLGVLAFEMAVISAIGVGLSAVITRQIFSVVCTYLVVAALSIGTLIAFGLLSVVTTTPVSSTTVYPEEFDDDGNATVCQAPQTVTYDVERPDLYWGILAANPYVVLADATPPSFDRQGQPTDLFTIVALGVREVQTPPGDDAFNDYCHESDEPSYTTARDQYADAAPSWFVGAGIHLLLGVGGLVWAGTRTRTPARRLPKGSRIA